jgi:hypothetical protein
MRRLLAVILFCAGMFCISQSEAFWQSRDSNYNTAIAAGGGGAVAQVDTNACTFSGATNAYVVSQAITATANGLIVIAAANDPAPTPEVLTATWGVQSMTSLAHISNTGGGGTIYIFGLRAPATGTQNLEIDMTPNPADRLYACSVSFKNVNQTSDALAFPSAGRTNGGSSQNGAGPFSINITSATGHMTASGAFDIAPGNTDSLSTTQYSTTTSNYIVLGNYQTGAATVTSTLTVSGSTSVGMVGVDVSP